MSDSWIDPELRLAGFHRSGAAAGRVNGIHALGLEHVERDPDLLEDRGSWRSSCRVTGSRRCPLLVAGRDRTFDAAAVLRSAIVKSCVVVSGLYLFPPRRSWSGSGCRISRHRRSSREPSSPARLSFDTDRDPSVSWAGVPCPGKSKLTTIRVADRRVLAGAVRPPGAAAAGIGQGFAGVGSPDI